MTHLNDEQITRYLGGAEDAATREHLQACSACRDEAARLLAFVGAARAEVEMRSTQPPAFWTRQRAAVASRIGQRRLLRPVWAVAAAFVVLLAVSVLLLRVEHPKPQAPRTITATVSDDALFSAIDATLQQQVPAALEPAQILADQRVQAEHIGNTDSQATRR